MAYGISQETIERVRSQADIVQVISEYLTLKKAGANYRALCPFHSEKTPSFMVSESKQIFRCFGCGAGGNVFGFLMKQEGFTFPESVRFLAQRLGIHIEEKKSAPGERDLRERLLELHEFATVFFHRGLMKSPQAEHARAYLKKRDLSDDAAKKFSIGIAPQGWDTLVSAAVREGFSKELLLQGGLAKKSAEGRVYDTFRNRIMFPISGLSGKVIAFGGRAIEDEQPKYMNSPETPIYQKSHILYNLNRAKKSIASEDSVIVVEGYTDVIRLVLGGIENVVASSGTAFTQAQARLIKRYASAVALVFDSDSAGIAAAGRGVEVLLGEDIAIRVAILPAGTDPDEFTRKQGPDAFRDILSNASNFIEFHIERALAEPKGTELESKIKTANTLASLVSRIPDPIRREEYLRLIASRLGIRPEILAEASQKSGFTDKLEEEIKHFERRLRRDEKEWVWLIKLMLERPECVEKVRENLDLDSIENEALRQIFDALFVPEGYSGDESVLLDRVQTDEAQQILSHVMFEEMRPEMLYPVDWWIGFIKRREKEKELTDLAGQIAAAEHRGDVESLEPLLRRKAQANRLLAQIRDGMLNISVDSAAGSAFGGFS